jgi:hypothetical protein
MAFEELEKQARSVSTEEKATPARMLIEDLNTAIDPNSERLWHEEARRYEIQLMPRSATLGNGKSDFKDAARL